MAHQLALTIIAQIKSGEVESLKQLLGTLHSNRQQTPLIPFDTIPKIHFARLFVIDATHDLARRAIPAHLVLLTDFDAPLDAHLQTLVDKAAAGLDQIYSYCEGYPEAAARTPDNRLAYLRDRMVKSKPFYANTPGRTVQQIQQEEQLRVAIVHFLASQDWSAHDPLTVRSAIQNFVRSQPDLAWAQLPPEAPALSWQLQERLHLVGMLILALLFLPVILLLLPLGLLLLRWHEEQEIPDSSQAEPERVGQLRADEDFGGQNQIIAIGFFKPTWLRRVTTVLVLELADYAIRHVYNRGSLSGLNTIHFARWVILDQNRRLFFVSNYDGSLESYMNDFIDKAFWGLNAIFTNGEGFPKTRWLFFGGIQDEQAYKRFLPTRQIPTQVWYSAYPNLSTVNIKNNSLIRAELWGLLSRSQTEAWLQRF